MATDTSIRYGPNRKAEPLSEREQTRLRQLAAKGRRSPLEKYDLGALWSRARHDPAGRRVLDDIAHGQAARRAPGRPVSARRGNRMVQDAITQALADAEDD